MAQEPSDPSAPQSAIPWLSESIRSPALVTPDEQPSARTAPEIAVIETNPTNGPDRDATGLISSEKAGFSPDMWRGGDSDLAIALLNRLPPSPLPGAQDLFFRLVLSEARPPARDDDLLLLTRIDALLHRGALDRAQALIERSGPDTPELFRRWFDISLLSGSEGRACGALEANADLSPSLPARIFCLVRAGRWVTASVTLESAWGLGDLSPEDYALLSRFLDPELFEGDPPLPRPKKITPLRFRLHEAIGEPLATRDLPLAFSWSDLRFIAGWKAQLEAAERLARVGSLDGNRLLGLYTERRAAASGAIWDRVRAVQALDLSLNAADHASLGAALIEAADVMGATGLEPALASMVAPRLESALLIGQPAVVATRLIMLDGTNPIAVPLQSTDTQRLAFDLIARIPPRGTLSTEEMSAIAGAFEGEEPPVHDGQAEATLAALTLLTPGAEADLQDRTAALRLLRAVGLEDTARRIAADYLLLEGHRP